ncbi:MAG: DNA alkylation repair protein [Patescibacteria group bacterium]|nr:DNA alkylation repair protein [Patescibacteria group bacterium]
MSKLINQVRNELKKYIDVEYRDGERRFFKEKVKNYGVRTPNRRKVAKDLLYLIKDLKKDKVFKICEEMLKSKYSEEATIAFDWVYRRKNEFEKKDFTVFKRWVEKYVDNWAKCDDFCTHSLGFLINKYPELSKKLFLWTKSKNRWVKRASAVTYIYPVNKPKAINWVMKTAKALLMDSDDMVQKGYGWMLKEASKNHLEKVFNYVMSEKHRMPRTALRYAIEKMDKKKKQAVM